MQASTLLRSAPQQAVASTSSRTTPLCMRRPFAPLPGRGGPSTRVAAEPSDASADEAEARLAALENNLTRGKAKPAKQFRVKGMAVPESEKPADPRAEWEEGKLFPEGWESMNPLQKTYEIYAGRRGLLFWLTELTWKGVFVLVGAWVVFRFIGPAVGLYVLADDF